MSRTIRTWRDGWTQDDANITRDVAAGRSRNGADVWERVPGIRGNWSLKGSLRAREKLRC